MSLDLYSECVAKIQELRGYTKDGATQFLERDLFEGIQSFSYCPRDEFKILVNERVKR